MLPLLSLFSLLAPLAAAVPCVQFDTAWNLYAFGGTEDVNLGQASSWAQPQVTPLTSTGRPPWTGNNTQCLLSQYNNAVYVLGADASDSSKVYIYSFAGNSWTTQSTTSAPPDFGNSRSATVLDHDTNVFFTLTSSSGLYQLDLSSVQAAASSEALAWDAVTQPSFSTTGYTPVAAQASNHINYFGVPNTAAGSADIFIVHFALFQEAAQAYPTQNGGSAFPNSGGQAFSIPDSGDSTPYQMVFVPNDFSNSYVVTHWTNPSDYTSTSGSPMPLSLVNTTQTLPAPSSKDPQAAYAASPSALVQIDTEGAIYYIENAVSDFAVASGASWQKLSYTLTGVSGGSSNTTASASSSASGSAATSGASATSAGASRSAGAGASASSGGAAAASSSGAAEQAVGEVRWGMIASALGLLGAGAVMVL